MTEITAAGDNPHRLPVRLKISLQQTSFMEQEVQYQVKEVPWPRTAFLAKRAQLSIATLPDFFRKAYAEIYSAIAGAGAPCNEPPFAIYYSVDEQKHKTDVAAAAVIHDTIQTPPGLSTVVIPAGKALLLTHFGSYQQMKEAYEALSKYAADHGMKAKWVLERYVSDPGEQGDPARLETDIYFVLA